MYQESMETVNRTAESLRSFVLLNEMTDLHWSDCSWFVVNLRIVSRSRLYACVSTDWLIKTLYRQPIQ